MGLGEPVQGPRLIKGAGAAANADVGLDTADEASDGKIGGAAGANAGS